VFLISNIVLIKPNIKYMFEGKFQILQSESRTFENDKKQQITFYKVSLLLSSGTVVKLSTTPEVFALIEGKKNVQGEGTIELRTSIFGGKESLKAVLVSFSSL